MKVSIRISMLVLICAISIFSQNNQEENFRKGAEIIKLAQKAIYKNKDITDLRSLFINLKESEILTTKSPLDKERVLEAVFKQTNERKFYLNEPNQFKIYSFEKTGDDSGFRKISVYNNDKNYSKWETLKDGAFVDFNLNSQKLGIPPVDYTIAAKKDYLALDIWVNIFPFCLKNFLDTDARFLYIGKAESPTGKADIVEIKSNNFVVEKRLFFDENTHLLLMTTSISNKEQDYKSRTISYYSDYYLQDGMLVPRQIKVQDYYIRKVELGINTTETQKEIEIVDFKANPKFDAKEFEIKDGKKAKVKQ